ncbi:hypothetical protein ACVOMT_03560 [Sphingomonas panni]
MTASEYIRLRRLAAKLSEHDLAQRMAALYVSTAERRSGDTMLDISKAMLLLLRAIELPGAIARRPQTIASLAAVLPFDVDVYWQLAQCPPDRHPRVCRGCATSAHDHDAPRWATRTSCERCDPAGDGL